MSSSTRRLPSTICLGSYSSRMMLSANAIFVVANNTNNVVFFIFIPRLPYFYPTIHRNPNNLLIECNYHKRDYHHSPYSSDSLEPSIDRRFHLRGLSRNQGLRSAM